MPPTNAATQLQLDAIVEFMQEHRDLARGLLRGADGRIRARRLWETLCSCLNSMGGCCKSLEQWQRVWADKKHLAKKNAAAVRRSTSGTGGGPSTAPPLSAIESKIIDIMGEGFGEPQTDARVAAFEMPGDSGFHSAAQPATPSPCDSGSHPVAQLATPSPVPLPQGEILQTAQRQPTEATAETSSIEQQQQRAQRQQPIRRRRRLATDDSVRSRLFLLEERRLRVDEERNQQIRDLRVMLQGELGALRTLLGELCRGLNSNTRL